MEGLPIRVITDNGVQFISNKAKDYFQKVGVLHSTTSLYNPSGNGVIERFNRVLKSTIQIYGVEDDKWEFFVVKTLWRYRTTPNDMTDCSPFEIMRGRLPSTKCSPSWLVTSTRSHIDLDHVKKKIEKTHATNKLKFNLKRGSKINPVVKVGMLVKVKKPWKVPKGQSQFMGPFTVNEVLKNSVRLSNGKVGILSRIAVLKGDNIFITRNVFLLSTGSMMRM